MFFFSSFLAGVPVIVMACFYVLYFGAYALNKTQIIENEIIPAVEEVVVASESANLEGNAFIYHHSKVVKQIVCSDLKDAPISFRPLKISPLIHSEPVFVNCYLTFDLFSRPPPSFV
jgi:hypothetical protein